MFSWSGAFVQTQAIRFSMKIFIRFMSAKDSLENGPVCQKAHRSPRRSLPVETLPVSPGRSAWLGRVRCPRGSGHTASRREGVLSETKEWCKN